jgi:hypothetical protein
LKLQGCQALHYNYEDRYSINGKDRIYISVVIMDKVFEEATKNRADLVSNVLPLTHARLTETSGDRRYIFRYTPPAEWLKELTADNVMARMAASVHQHVAWATQAPNSTTLHVNMARFIAAYETCLIKAGKEDRNCLFSCPRLGLVVRLDSHFACIYCGAKAETVPKEDRVYCGKCDVTMHCRACTSKHTVLSSSSSSSSSASRHIL